MIVWYNIMGDMRCGNPDKVKSEITEHMFGHQLVWTNRHEKE